MADVFISYKRAERDSVERIEELLRKDDISVWFDGKLEAGRNEGFDAEIEREVTSAHCVLVCWTREALKSIYVKAEAKKGLEREVLVPIFLEPCTLPVPFNVVDAIDLTNWSGEEDAPGWKRVLESVRRKVDSSRADVKLRMFHSRAAYERVDDKIYPGTLALLVRRIAAIGDWDARDYREDIDAIFTWLGSIAEKEMRYHIYGYDLADRQSGGGAWMFWDRGGAAERGAQIRELRSALSELDATLARSQELLNRPAP
jgi:hypothetical protein